MNKTKKLNIIAVAGNVKCINGGTSTNRNAYKVNDLTVSVVTYIFIIRVGHASSFYLHETNVDTISFSSFPLMSFKLFFKLIYFDWNTAVV